MKQPSLASVITKYLFGFGSALVLSVVAYLLVVEQWFDSPATSMAALLLLATIQLAVQLICFLHLGMKGEGRSKTVTVLFTIFMMLIIVVGSLWVMRNLDYRMGMSPEAMTEYMLEQNKKGF